MESYRSFLLNVITGLSIPMQDFNLPGSLGNRNPQVSVGASTVNVASTGTVSPSLPTLLPVSISQTGSHVRLLDQSNRVIASGTSTSTINQAVSAALGEKSESITLFSQRKNLFDAIVSAEQQKVILEATSRQPNLIKIALGETQSMMLRSAVVVSVNNQILNLKLTPPFGELSQLSLEQKAEKVHLKPGQAVQVQVQQIGDKWIAKLIVPSNPRDAQKIETKDAVVTSINNQTASLKLKEPIGDLSRISVDSAKAPLNLKSGQTVQVQVQQINNKWVANLVTDTNIPLSRQSPVVETIVKNVLQGGINLNQAPKVTEAVLALLPKFQPSSEQQSQQINRLSQQNINTIIQHPVSISKLTLSESRQMTVSSQLPVATVKLDNPEIQTTKTADAKQLQTLPKLVEQSLARFTALPEKHRNELLETLKIMPNESAPSKIEISNAQPASNADVVSIKGIGDDRSNTNINTAAKQPVPKAFIEQLSSLIRQHFINASPSSESATNLTQALSQIAQSSDANLREFSKQIQQALLPLITKKEPDLAQIQALMQMPAMPVAASSLAQIAPINSMVSGLIALLQVSLATRLPQRQTSASDKLGQILNQLTQATPAAAATAGSQASSNQTASTAKTFQEFTQVEQRNQLLRTLSKTLSNHQYSKLASADASLQGTDTLFYSLPSYSNTSHRDIELLVKRESGGNQQTKAKSEQTSTWHLTMLMDIGEYGELLSKCKLKDYEISLDIYTSSELLKIRVLDFLPLLNKRLTSFGLDILSTQCQLGKIPESLRPKPYQLLHTQA